MVVGLKDEKGSLHAISCDLREEGQILSMFEEIKGLHGGVDVCVNCAGLGKIASLIDGETEKWREVLEVSLFMAIKICKFCNFLTDYCAVCSVKFLDTFIFINFQRS